MTRLVEERKGMFNQIIFHNPSERTDRDFLSTGVRVRNFPVTSYEISESQPLRETGLRRVEKAMDRREIYLEPDRLDRLEITCDDVPVCRDRSLTYGIRVCNHEGILRVKI